MELSQEQKNKLEKVAKFLTKTEISNLLPIHELLEEIRDQLKAIAEKEIPETETPEKYKVEVDKIEGVELITLKGDTGKQGIQGVPGKDGKEGKSGKDGLNGKDGKDGKNGLDGLDGKDGKDGKDGSPDTAEQIRDKIESLKNENRLDKSAIKGLNETVKELETRISNIPRGGGGRASHSMKIYDLSSLTDGATKIFTVPKHVSAFVIGSDFPTVLMKNNGFTENATTTQITLTVENAPSLGSQLALVYSEYFNS